MTTPEQISIITKEDDERNNIVGGIDVNRLRSIIERIERLEEEKSDIQKDITGVYNEAKGEGFDQKVMRQVIKLRKMAANDRAEYLYLSDEYNRLLGIE